VYVPFPMMARRFQAYRFVYRLAGGEWPLGAMLVEVGRDTNSFADISFRQDLETLLNLDPDADPEYLAAVERDIRALLRSTESAYIDSETPTSWREWVLRQIRENFANTLEVLDPTELETDSPAEALKTLALSHTI